MANDPRLGLEWLAPPPGGIRRLQAALRRPPPTAVWRPAMAGLAAAAVLWWLVLPRLEHWREDELTRQQILDQAGVALSSSWRELDLGAGTVRVHLAMAEAEHTGFTGSVR